MKPVIRHSSFAVGVLLLLVPALLLGAELPIADHPLRRIRSETLVYRVRAWKGVRALAMNLGTATFTLSRDDERASTGSARPEPVEGRGERQLVFRAVAEGSAMGYVLESTMTARLRDSDYRMREADSVRLKPSYKARRMRFHRLGADYLKHKHCTAPLLCHNREHLVRNAEGKLVHCQDCEDPKHYVWHLAERHRYTGAAYDLLAAVYLARGFPIEVGGPAQVLRVGYTNEMWDIEFKAVKEETLSVPAGEIRCLKIAMTTKPANEYTRKHADDFEGPFGLHGQINLYVDKETKQPVLVRGKVDAGTTFEVEVALSDRKVEHFPPREGGGQ